MRLQQILLRLQHYGLQVTYRKGNELYVADTLNRAYQEINLNDTLEEELEINVLLPVSAGKLNESQETRKDPSLPQLNHEFVSPTKVAFIPFHP